MKKIDIKDFNENVFEMVSKDWLLINTYNDEKVNSMTASWGTFGHLWHKNVAMVFIRPQRYTCELIQKNDVYSLSVLDNSYRKELNYLGTASGRDEDKLKVAGLTVKRLEDNTPILEEARLNIVVRKMYVDQFREDSFLDKEVLENRYKNRDFSHIFIGEVMDIYEK